MGSKGERTRAEVIQRTAELMNQRGFLAASMGAVVEATGLQKGGLYRHFESREALAHEAFDFAVGQVRDRLLAAVGSATRAPDRLLAMLDAYGDSGNDVPLPGGCPIMNTAIEADHADPALRERAQAAMQAWQGMVARIVDDGMRRGELRAGVDAQAFASVFIACIEGGVMLSQLHGDPRHLNAARTHLRNQVHALVPSAGEPP